MGIPDLFWGFFFFFWILWSRTACCPNEREVFPKITSNLVDSKNDSRSVD
jgi:hypothetical protein